MPIKGVECPLPYPEVLAQFGGEHLLELGIAQRVFVTLVAGILVEGLDHELHGVLQGGRVLGVGQRHAAVSGHTPHTHKHTPANIESRTCSIRVGAAGQVERH